LKLSHDLLHGEKHYNLNQQLIEQRGIMLGIFEMELLILIVKMQKKLSMCTEKDEYIPLN
jgi:hypothetical protein